MHRLREDRLQETRNIGFADQDAHDLNSNPIILVMAAAINDVAEQGTFRDLHPDNCSNRKFPWHFGASTAFGEIHDSSQRGSLRHRDIGHNCIQIRRVTLMKPPFH